MKIKKDERGSVTLFVLVACMFMLVILLLVNISITNRNSGQNKELDRIEEEYAQNKTSLDEIYAKASNQSK